MNETEICATEVRTLGDLKRMEDTLYADAMAKVWRNSSSVYSRRPTLWARKGRQGGDSGS